MTEIIKVNYVEYLYPGMIVSDSSYESISNLIPTLVKPSEHAYGFRFFTRNEVNPGTKGALIGPKEYVGGTYYIAPAKVYNKKEVASMPEDKRGRMLDNMSNNEKVVNTRTGNWFMFEKGDMIVDI